MPVIINEFEVIAEAPQPAQAAASPPAGGGQPTTAPEPLRPVDIIRIQEHHEQRMARLAAD